VDFKGQSCAGQTSCRESELGFIGPIPGRRDRFFQFNFLVIYVKDKSTVFHPFSLGVGDDSGDDQDIEGTGGLQAIRTKAADSRNERQDNDKSK